MRLLRIPLVILALVGLIALAGCGGDDSTDSTDGTSSEALSSDEYAQQAQQVLVEFGTSANGKPMLIAFLSDAQNLLALDKWRDVSRRLALGMATPAEARKLAAEGKAIVWIDSGLHASEVAPVQHSLDLAYRMVAAEDDETRRIRANVVLMQVQAVDKQKNFIIFRKIRDVKGKHPTDVIKHNIGMGGLRANEWKPQMDWAEPGKVAIMFHNGGASETCIGTWWYQAYAGGEWWNHSHAEPFL